MRPPIAKLVAVLPGIVFGLLSAPVPAATTYRITPMIEQFAVADDGTPLTWAAYLAPGPGSHPSVLVIHGGGFFSDENGPKQVDCAQDLAEAGMNAFIISYRLAPPGKISGQRSDGRYPDQTNDVLLAVHAARVDGRGNGKVGAVGGSAGGSHLIYVAATGTKGDDQIDVGVSLSGAYDFADEESWTWQDGSFYDWVTNYVGSRDPAKLAAASPITYVNKRMPPLLLYGSMNEAMPPEQLTNLTMTLNSFRVSNYQVTTFSGHGHSFSYWSKVKRDAIAFLQDTLDR
jgi:acetyl esterase/lipase